MKRLESILQRIREKTLERDAVPDDELLLLYDQFAAEVDAFLTQRGIEEVEVNTDDYLIRNNEDIDADILGMLYSKIDYFITIERGRNLTDEENVIKEEIIDFIHEIEEGNKKDQD